MPFNLTGGWNKLLACTASLGPTADTYGYWKKYASCSLPCDTLVKLQ